MSITRGQELGEELRLPELSGQDVNAGQSDWGTVDLGKIIYRFSDDLWGKADYRH